MDDLEKSVKGMLAEVDAAYAHLGLDAKERQLAELNQRIQQPGFWDNVPEAQATMQAQAALQKRLNPWLGLRRQLYDVRDLAQLHDASIFPELTDQLLVSQSAFDALKDELKLSGPYDDYDAILSIHAG